MCVACVGKNCPLVTASWASTNATNAEQTVTRPLQRPLGHRAGNDAGQMSCQWKRKSVKSKNVRWSKDGRVWCLTSATTPRGARPGRVRAPRTHTASQRNGARTETQQEEGPHTEGWPAHRTNSANASSCLCHPVGQGGVYSMVASTAIPCRSVVLPSLQSLWDEWKRSQRKEGWHGGRGQRARDKHFWCVLVS